ncbi:hypothetical protein GS464_20075 [Rhodococcus hoagii]|nr:hypothetical protein [Prescottella equi]
MTDTERQEFKKMVTDMALLKQSNEKIIEPALKTISAKLDKLDFYTKDEVDEKLRTMQRRRWYENTISALAGSILTTIVMYFVTKLLTSGTEV